jgi:uncharacterized protein YggE
MTRITKTAATAAAGLAVFGLTACGGGSNNKTEARTIAATSTGNATGPSIAVAGHGKVEGAPDTATVTIGVETHDPSAQAALNRNNVEATALINELKAKGVAAKDIQTSNLSVNPDYDLKGHVTGYGVSNTVTVKLRDLTNAGKIIDAAAATVGNDIRLQGVEFSIDNTSALIAKARADAVKDALAQGHQLADAGGVTLGAIRLIDDTGTQLPQPQFFAGDAARSTINEAPVPFEKGTQELSVDVTVVFDIG